MKNKLSFQKIEKEKIFKDSYLNFKRNNEIDFSQKNIAILYGSNGTGKTSLSKVLNQEDGTNFEAKYNETNKTEMFHVIKDFAGRNIIAGNPKEFFIGDEIKREYELKETIEKEFKILFETRLSKGFKDNFIKKKTSLLLDKINDGKLKEFIKDIINIQSKGKNLEKKDFLNYIDQLIRKEDVEYEQNKLDFLLEDFSLAPKKSIISRIINLNKIECIEEVEQIEENEDAIKILNKFNKKKQCIVCDNDDYDCSLLLGKKRANQKKIYKKLDDETKALLEDIEKKITMEDEFKIKKVIFNSIKEGSIEPLKLLIKEFEKYFEIFNNLIHNLFLESLKETNLVKFEKEYLEILGRKPEISEEDFYYLKHIVSENIEGNITLDRDDNNNLKLLLNEENLIGVDREKLSLSTGEQNFISLSLELLKAKNSEKEIIVLDDPISSFDSIYKNKIAFSLVKTLGSKKQIILSHNMDLVRLIYFQKKDCFNLYIFNNAENAENGFIPIEEKEQDILLSTRKLLELFKGDIFNHIKDSDSFFMSTIPFMRGYSNLIFNSEIYKKLSKLMHGYEIEEVDIIDSYNDLFSTKYKGSLKITVEDILKLDVGKLEILDDNVFPLLNRTLKHTLIYLYLRLKVEKELVEKYKIKTKGQQLLLNKIIFKAFKGKSNMKNRVFFTSRKTLLNDFNHFEGNMNIFEPAIDITDEALDKERKGIIDKLNSL